MAYDFLLLQRYQLAEALRIRHYDWRRPAYTFGLSQKHSYVRSEIEDQTADICRRPTGGGIVNHIEDWTYALVIPASHPLSRGQPIDAYRSIHQAIVDAISKQDIETTLNLQPPENTAPGVCFSKPELYDVVLRNLPTKVAGAAQKRTKSGYLLQGSIWKPTLGNIDWTRFYGDFIFEVARLANASTEYGKWPGWNASEEEALVDQFDSEDWNQRR